MYSANDLRQKFLDYFFRNGHQAVPSASIVPENDSSVLLTSAGMQQFKPYYTKQLNPLKDNHPGLGKPLGANKVASIQKCFRTSDIESVGDASHLTFFEMLGNFSFGGYGKQEAFSLAYRFLTEELGLSLGRMTFTYFQGDGTTPKDTAGYDAIVSLGIAQEKIIGQGREDNFWGPTGNSGPCGPTIEIYLDGLEVWNIVFNEFYSDEQGGLTPLGQMGIDTGMGLERLTLVSQFENLSQPLENNHYPTIFDTDLFKPLIDKLLELANLKAATLEVKDWHALRIMADHLRGSFFLITDGVLPSNTDRGYILRRIIRRAARYAQVLKLKDDWLRVMAEVISDNYKNFWPQVGEIDYFLEIFTGEEKKFEKSLEKGTKDILASIANHKKRGETMIPGEEAFGFYETSSLPLEVTTDIAQEQGMEVDAKGFEEAFKKHQEISRAGVEKKFGGHGLKDGYDWNEADVQILTKLHSATHLVFQALRETLDPNIIQRGSDINSERARLDFNFPRKLLPEELKQVEDLVNAKIRENLIVSVEEMPVQDALASGAIGVFSARYPAKVTVYSFEDKNGTAWSKEICAGPHVKETKEIGAIKIIKEEASSAGVRRLKLQLI
ncbi:MAG TPA: alanine--tRNA ligase-related protein [Candidatus Paceibacterota bacterium]|nr:alanine--tRNA ligase-related protein [Candidatus Paceibacterota bacterium]